MPCYDGREESTARELEAMVCGLMRVIDPDALDRVDWEAAGISRKRAEEIWREHQRRDERKRDARD